MFSALCQLQHRALKTPECLLRAAAQVPLGCSSFTQKTPVTMCTAPHRKARKALTKPEPKPSTKTEHRQGKRRARGEEKIISQAPLRAEPASQTHPQRPCSRPSNSVRSGGRRQRRLSGGGRCAARRQPPALSPAGGARRPPAPRFLRGDGARPGGPAVPPPSSPALAHPSLRPDGRPRSPRSPAGRGHPLGRGPGAGPRAGRGGPSPRARRRPSPAAHRPALARPGDAAGSAAPPGRPRPPAPGPAAARPAARSCPAAAPTAPSPRTRLKLD